PTNFLDIHSIEALEDLLIEYPGTLIFVSHDRRFTEKIAERIFHITEEKLHVFEGDYQSFLHRETTEPDAKEEQLLIIQTKLTEVISKLSLEPSDDLEEVYQQLLKEKQALERP